MTNRRSFIKKTALASAGLGFAMKASSYNSILGANDRIHICLMGLGRRVGGYYSILEDKFNTKLLYLCDVKRSQVDKSLGILKDKIDYKPKVEEDVRKILEDKKLDVVFVATPDHWHAPATVMALDAGKHVFVEKPCAHNPREAEVMVARQKETGLHVQMGNQQRSSPHTIEIVKEIKNGLIGNPYKAVAIYNNKRGKVPNQKKQAPPEDLNWELFQGPAPRQDYFHDIWNYNWHWYGWKWGTAETGNNAVHELDVARWAMDIDYPESVYVDADKQHYLDDGWEMYDTMNAVFKFKDRKTIVWDGKSRNGYNTYGTGRGTVIYGTEGSVLVNRSYYKLFDREGKLVKESKKKSNESGLALGGGGDTTTEHTNNLLEAIRGKEALRAPIADAAKSNHMALLANIAYRTSAMLKIDTETGKVKDDQAMKLWSRKYEPGWEIA
ncbi:MAG: Gfo/Idh/MocA family oxidoreductase [Bacteroidota bacterium]